MKIERVNIGLAIEQKLNELGMSKSEFGRKIGIPQQNVNRILEKPNIDTEKLITVSEALGYNFFEDYVGEHNAVANGDGSVAVSGNNNTSVVNGALATGNGSVAVKGNNNNHVVGNGHAGTEILEEKIRLLEELLAEKERLIQVLMEGRK